MTTVGMLLGGQKSTILQHVRGILKFEEQLARVKWSYVWSRVESNMAYVLSNNFTLYLHSLSLKIRNYSNENNKSKN